MSRRTDEAERAATPGRRLGMGAVVFGAAYLAWRIGWSWGDRPGDITWWLAAPALAVEVAGFVALALMLWALGRRAIVPAAPDAAESLDHVVAITAEGWPADDLRATLVALRLEPVMPAVVVVDHFRRAEVKQLADTFGAGYVVAPADDTSGFGSALAATSQPWVLFLRAGDIPARGIVSTMSRWTTDPTVGAVQGVVTAAVGDSAEHGPTGRHDLLFERTALNPALGSRGCAFVTGTATLVRRGALDSIGLPNGPRHSVLWGLTGRLAARGRKVVVAAGAPVATHRPAKEAMSVADDRGLRASAAWQLIAGEEGALRAVGLPVRARLSLAAWAVRPLEGVRRLALAAVVLGALLAGRAPFEPAALAMGVLWAPSFVLGSLALMVMSAGALQPGDRLRTSVRSIKVSVALVVAINSILMVRGISDRFTHALRPMNHTIQIALIVVALWLLAGCLDSLRLLARRRRGRRAPRQSAAASGNFGGVPVHIADVTMFGAGVLIDHAVRLGNHDVLTFALPSESGVTTLDLAAVVRNANVDPNGRWRVGLEFEGLDGASLDALAECCVVSPARAALVSGHSSTAAHDDDFGDQVDDVDPQRSILRVATLLALAGVISSAAPVAAEASGPVARTVRGTVTVAPAADDELPPPPDSVVYTIEPDTLPTEPATTTTVAGEPLGEDLGGVTVVGACSIDAGSDDVHGTADDIYGPSVSTLTADDGSYELVVSGEACWISIAPPVPLDAPAASPPPEMASPPMLATVVDLGESGDVEMPPIEIGSSLVRTPRPAATNGASIGDRVWDDLDGDGLQDPDEDGISDASVTLYDQTGSVVDTRVTGDDGSFSFDDVARGWYSLGVSNVPAGLRAPAADALASRGPLLAIEAGDTIATADIGLVSLSSAVTAPSTVRDALPPPDRDQIAPVRSNDGSPSSLPGVLAIVMAAVLAASVLWASARPSDPRPTLQ